VPEANPGFRSSKSVVEDKEHEYADNKEENVEEVEECSTVDDIGLVGQCMKGWMVVL